MNSRTAWIGLIVLFFLAGAAGSYFFLKHFTPLQQAPIQNDTSFQATDGQASITVRIFTPKDGKLETLERKIPKKTGNFAVAEAVLEEFFKNSGAGSSIPQNVKLLGLYRDINRILYIDFSEELRRNFQGDALSEYLLLKGIYESLTSNVQDYQDIKILVEGKEIESLGGHLFLKYPLKSIALLELKTESKAANE